VIEIGCGVLMIGVVVCLCDGVAVWWCNGVVYIAVVRRCSGLVMLWCCVSVVWCLAVCG
jgi:hypothetical protein